MRIALLPLDERPVNATLPAHIAAIAGAEVLTPPAELLPRMRTPGRADELAGWLAEVAGEVDALVVSLDTLGYGGLIGSRTTQDAASAVVERLAVLERIRPRHPRLPITAVTTVMRASRSYSPAEEPEYWSRHGVELHDLGGALHREFLGEPHERERLTAAVPADVQADFWLRRLRNHTVDLFTLGLAGRGTLDTLLVTADDTAPRAAGSLEQVWLRHWVSATGLGTRVLMYPGADEVGSVLVARALADGEQVEEEVRIAVEFREEGGADRIAPYENVPIAAGVARQIAAAGAEVVPFGGEHDDADAVIVVHAPDPRRGDQTRRGEATDQAVVDAVVDRVAELVEAGSSVGVADVRYVNGADPALVRALAERGVLDRITAYGGWNTAGNTVGSVVAALVAHVVGHRRGGVDEIAQSRLRWHRIVEDYAYQAVVRGELAQEQPYGDHMSVPFADQADVESYLERCAKRLPEVAEQLGGADARRWLVTSPRLPWGRTFEIDFDLVPRT
ncbi:Protein of unknown function [Actinopolymorpha cephalotaxi]|uniref:DUF4127 family protein n=1 Tax=Actinopolymorpha cephalotaxi TaxID=504797 RepID=A0A1I2XQS8_9ACTN|nr:DUF4127 family protein [Actinopolymorpha cephalotaxi]NYH87139.1 hypothetical protein [Actinopolymorpha cephalotaxi]SFH15868.1 Protein of unknown function [Actinopolymorpha cephalotaxi]